MDKITTTLFDFDGVVANTESQYDIFWTGIEKKYQLGIPDFSARIKGTTIQHIFNTYFPHLSRGEQQKISTACLEFERDMDYEEVPGSVEFLHILKNKGYRVGLVTSSLVVKMEIALKKMDLETAFDTIVTADRITRGKPDPMGYLLAAKDLGTESRKCVVFEDAFTGIQAGTIAGMKVIGLATTNPVAALEGKVAAVIPDFRDAEHILALF